MFEPRCLAFPETCTFLRQVLRAALLSPLPVLPFEVGWGVRQDENSIPSAKVDVFCRQLPRLGVLAKKYHQPQFSARFLC